MKTYFYASAVKCTALVAFACSALAVNAQRKNIIRTKDFEDASVTSQNWVLQGPGSMSVVETNPKPRAGKYCLKTSLSVEDLGGFVWLLLWAAVKD